jgi:hypothetical protein
MRAVKFKAAFLGLPADFNICMGEERERGSKSVSSVNHFDEV